MILNERKGNLFDLNKDIYYFAHCISADYELGAGIAVQFQKRFKLKSTLKNIGSGTYPDLITINNVFNLVTKGKYWNKPTYKSITQCIKYMRDYCIKYNIHYLAMPKIGCGLDKLQWGKVREIIKEEFKDVDIQIEIRYL